MAQNAKKGRTYIPFSSQITVNPLRMSSQDIAVWKTAIDAARNTTNPKRKQLYELYDNIKIDGHLEAVMDKRKMAITNKRVLFVDKGGKESDNVKEYLLSTPWFYDFLSHAIDQVSYGHSLIELIPEQGIISSVNLINRANVMPETGFVMFNYSNDQDGIYFRGEKAEPTYNRYLIEVGGTKDYGKLMTAAQYVIYKRGGFGDWSQFAELFGMPFRVGKYNPFDDTTRTKLSTALSEMGGAGYAIIPDGTSLEFHQNNGQGQSDIFKEMITMCNSEISKIFLGQTMTTDNGSSRSQSETHKFVEEDINLSDMLRIEYLLNWTFKDKMAELGFNELLNGNFHFENTQVIPLEKQIDIDLKVAAQVPIDEKYWYEKYGVPMPDGKTRPINADDTGEEDTTTEGNQKKSLIENGTIKLLTNTSSIESYITKLYASKCDHPEHNLSVVTLADNKGSDKIWSRISKGIHNGEIKPGYVDPELYSWIAKQLFTGVTKGFGGGFDKFYTDEPDYKMLANLEKNVHIFSAFKTYHELREATNLLTDKEGKVRPFSEFKTEILKVHEKYNVNWLNTEYNQAIASSQMASVWVDIEANKEALPYLKYQTAGDDRVRASHSALDGITKKIDDAFWDTYYPPNDWGCRCDVVQLANGTITNTSKTKLPLLKPMFDNNTAKKGVVFPASHPYYKVAKEDKENAKNLWNLDVPDKNKKA